jgi:DNA-binding MarR family transcriptional regulator
MELKGRLERKGLVECCDHPIHRRARIVHLTAAGRKTIECAFARKTAMDRAASGLAAAERKRAVDLMRKFERTAQSRLQNLGKNRALSR